MNDENKVSLYPQEDGYIIFETNGKWGLMNPIFSIIVSPSYPELNYVEHNVLKFDWYFMDYCENELVQHNGKFIKLPSNFCFAYELTENVFKVNAKENSGNLMNVRVGLCGLISLIESEVKVIMPFKYSKLSLVQWNDNRCILFEEDAKKGVADLNGNILLPNVYNGFYIPVREKFVIMWNKDENGEKTFGLLSCTFEEILPPVHQIVRFPKDDIVVFMLNKIWGIYSLERKSAKIFYEYSYIEDFFKGFSRVKKGGKSFFVRDSECFYDDETYTIGYFFNEKQQIVRGGLWGVIDKDGNEILPCIYDVIDYSKDGKYVVKKGGKWGIMTNYGKGVTQIIYEDIIDCGNGIFILKSNDLYGFITSTGTIIECGYSDVMPFKGDSTPFCQNGLWGFINKSGDIIIPTQYQDIMDDNKKYYCYLGSKLYLGKNEEEYDTIDYNGVITSSIRYEEDSYDEDLDTWYEDCEINKPADAPYEDLPLFIP